LLLLRVHIALLQFGQLRKLHNFILHTFESYMQHFCAMVLAAAGLD
jgi:hypothetical protein